jgi:spore germination cell wall hydrolase CwlJ-like protein
VLDPAEALRITDHFLLALCIWREARGEPYMSRVAVACSIMNRVKNPKWWGTDIQSVVTKKWQYSSMTASSDVQLILFPTRDDRRWYECLQVADDAMYGRLNNPVPGADSYFDNSIAPPNWADPRKFIGAVGAFRFYNLDGDVEANAALTKEVVPHG